MAMMAVVAIVGTAVIPVARYLSRVEEKGGDPTGRRFVSAAERAV